MSLFLNILFICCCLVYIFTVFFFFFKELRVIFGWPILFLEYCYGHDNRPQHANLGFFFFFFFFVISCNVSSIILSFVEHKFLRFSNQDVKYLFLGKANKLILYSGDFGDGSGHLCGWLMKKRRVKGESERGKIL